MSDKNIVITITGEDGVLLDMDVLTVDQFRAEVRAHPNSNILSGMTLGTL